MVKVQLFYKQGQDIQQVLVVIHLPSIEHKDYLYVALKMINEALY